MFHGSSAENLSHSRHARLNCVMLMMHVYGLSGIYILLSISFRYIQVGNAVAVPISRALGFALAQALQKNCGEEPLFRLPALYIKVGNSTNILRGTMVALNVTRQVMYKV